MSLSFANDIDSPWPQKLKGHYNSTSSVYATETISAADKDSTQICIGLLLQAHMLRDVVTDSVWIMHEEFHIVPDLPPNYGGHVPLNQIPHAALVADARGDDELLEHLRAGSIPTANTIVRYISMLQWLTQSPVECDVIAYMYLNRIVKASHMALTTDNWRMLWATSFILAHKVWCEKPLRVAAFAALLPRVTVEQLKSLQHKALELVEYNISCSLLDYAKYYFELHNAFLTQICDQAAYLTWRLKPLSQRGAERLELRTASLSLGHRSGSGTRDGSGGGGGSSGGGGARRRSSGSGSGSGSGGSSIRSSCSLRGGFLRDRAALAAAARGGEGEGEGEGGDQEGGGEGGGEEQAESSAVVGAASAEGGEEVGVAGVERSLVPLVAPARISIGLGAESSSMATAGLAGAGAAVLTIPVTSDSSCPVSEKVSTETGAAGGAGGARGPSAALHSPVVREREMIDPEGRVAVTDTAFGGTQYLQSTEATEATEACQGGEAVEAHSQPPLAASVAWEEQRPTEAHSAAADAILAAADAEDGSVEEEEEEGVDAASRPPVSLAAHGAPPTSASASAVAVPALEEAAPDNWMDPNNAPLYNCRHNGQNTKSELSALAQEAQEAQEAQKGQEEPAADEDAAVQPNVTGLNAEVTAGPPDQPGPLAQQGVTARDDGALAAVRTEAHEEREENEENEVGEENNSGEAKEENEENEEIVEPIDWRVRYRLFLRGELHEEAGAGGGGRQDSARAAQARRMFERVGRGRPVPARRLSFDGATLKDTSRFVLS